MTCPICNEKSDGLDGIHCQEDWENICAQGWWQMVNGGVVMHQTDNNLMDPTPEEEVKTGRLRSEHI